MAKLTLEKPIFHFSYHHPRLDPLRFQHLFVLLLTNLFCAWYVVNKLLKPYSLGS